MNLEASFQKYTLKFKRPSGTSRGVLQEKNTWIIRLYERETKTVSWGECSPLVGLSWDDRPDYEEKLKEICQRIQEFPYWLDKGLEEFPSIRFGLEMALLDLEKGGKGLLFPSSFTKGLEGIKINGLIWMGSFEFMRKQIEEKLSQGFSCLKMKIGALDFDREFSLLRNLRERFSERELELRVDANGGFSVEEALSKLEKLASLKIHSIEQPIAAGQVAEMANLCKKTPLPIALDEELIGVNSPEKKFQLLKEIKPQYIILKPSLLGGFEASRCWIKAAEEHNIRWWITSALESNIGLNAIAQWTFTLYNDMAQGLGTGGLYLNNIPAPLSIKNAKLFFSPEQNWDLSVFK